MARDAAGGDAGAAWQEPALAEPAAGKPAPSPASQPSANGLLSWLRMFQPNAGSSAERVGDTAPFARVSLSRRVRATLEATPAGACLDVVSSLLAMLTVCTYIAETYQMPGTTHQAVRVTDLACSVAFSLEWAFWCWLAPDKLMYVFSTRSFVDLVTIVPLYLSYFIEPGERQPGFSTVLALLRFLRVLRVYRIFRLLRRVADDVANAICMLVFTVLAVLLVGASWFYEVERVYSPSNPDLTFIESIYWATVTVTTIGYGDFAPTMTASRLLLLLMLVISFTVLPYQTGRLLAAYQATSVYERHGYSQARRGRHVVLLGSLHAGNAARLLDELFHADYGFQGRSVVLLSPRPPDTTMRRLLKARPANRVVYIQGSALEARDLGRAQVDLADVLFVLTDQQAADPGAEDEANAMQLLSAGQYIQACQRRQHMAQVQSLRRQLTFGLRRLLAKLQPAKFKGSSPRVYMQLLLPGSREKLLQALDAMCLQQGRGLAMGGGSHAPVSGTPQRADSGRKLPGMAAGRGAGGSGGAAAAAGGGGAALLGGAFWRRFLSDLSILCVSEMKAALLGSSCLACPGLTTLLTNMVTSVDAATMLPREWASLPPWLQHHLSGASNELYEVRSFPPSLCGRPFAQVAQYVLDVHSAVLVALGDGSGGGGALLLAPTALAAVQPYHRGYILASDLRVAADIMEDDPAMLADWMVNSDPAAATAGGDGGGKGKAAAAAAGAAKEEEAGGGGAAQALIPAVRAAPELVAPPLVLGGVAEEEAGGQPAGAAGAAGVAAGSPECGGHHRGGALGGPPHEADGGDVLQPLTLQAGMGYKPLARSGGSLARMSSPAELVHSPRHTGTNAAGAAPPAPPPAATAAAAPGAPAQHAPPQQQSQRCAWAAVGTAVVAAPRLLLHAPLAAASIAADAVGLTSGGAAASGLGGPKRSRRTIEYRGGSLAEAGGQHLADTDASASSPHLRQASALLASASRRGRRSAGAFLALHYALRGGPLGSGAGSARDAVCDQVSLSGHLLVCGEDLAPGSLLQLLAPLRSLRLPAWQPVVVLAHPAPHGPMWDQVARLADVHFVVGDARQPDDLLRANAEQAERAIVLGAGLRGCAAQAHAGSCASGGMGDAAAVFVCRQLQHLRPGMPVWVDLGSDSAAVHLDSCGRLVESGGGPLAACAVPSFISGAALLPRLFDCALGQTSYNRVSTRLIMQLLTAWHADGGGPAGADQAAPAAHGAAAASRRISEGAATRPVVPLQLPVDAGRHGTFGGLFRALLAERQALCMALYRPVCHLGQCFSAVLTAPAADAQLLEGDRAIVLLPLAPGEQLPGDACGLAAAGRGDEAAAAPVGEGMAAVVAAAMAAQAAAMQQEGGA